MDDEQQHEEHGGGIKSFFSHLSTKQKIIGGAVIGVLGLAIAAARKNGGGAGEAAPLTGMPDPVQIPVPVTIPSSGGSGSGGGSGGSSGGGTPPPDVPVYTPPVLGPTQAPPPVPQKATPAPVPGYTPVISLPGSYGSLSGHDLQVVQTRDADIATLINSGSSLSAQQQKALRDEVAQLDKTPIAANEANTSGVNPIGGFGGGNYYTDGAAVAAGIALNENKLAADPAFVQSEIARTQAVIAARQAAGVGYADQTVYLNHLHDVEAAAASGSSTGATSTRTPSPSPTPTPATNQQSYLENLAAGRNPDGTAASAGNMAWAKAQLGGGPVLTGSTQYTTVTQTTGGGGYGGNNYGPAPSSSGGSGESTAQLVADQMSHQSSQTVDGHVNPYYSTGKTISQAQYNQLEKQVQAGGSAAQSALSQLSGARVV